MNRSRNLALLLFFSTIVPSFGGPPRDQGFWTFFGEGLKDDLTLIGLGAHAGLRVVIPGFSTVEDMVRGEDATILGATAEVADLSGFALDTVKDVLTETKHPLHGKALKAVKKIDRFVNREHYLVDGRKLRHLSPVSRKLFGAATVIGWVGMAVDSFVELSDAKRKADDYLASREREYERMRRENERRAAAKKAAAEKAEEKHPCIPCWAGDLVGTCSDPDCPNYGQPHSKYKGGGVPAFGLKRSR